MERKLLIQELKNYFDIRELVCSHTFEKFGEKSWQFFDREFLEVLLIVRRDILKVRMFINNYHYTKQEPIYDERGFRCNLCPLCKAKTFKGSLYLSAHLNGAGLDFDAEGLTPAQVQEKIKVDVHLLPCKVRMEAGVSWNHLDIYDDPQAQKFSTFNA